MYFDDKGEQRYPMQRSGDIWHLFVYGVGSGTLYGFRVSGDVDEQKAHYLIRINCCLIRMLNE
ncbi:glycogen operon protein [Actinobacillus equuli]|nr:glycogen operon protein [Actinobacillus equuli]